MGQLPQDPQQLAQDILAGRVTIQQLRAEQARRRAAQEALRQNMRPRAGPSTAAPARSQSPRQVGANSTPTDRPSSLRQQVVRPDNVASSPAMVRKIKPPTPKRPASSDTSGISTAASATPSSATVPAGKKSSIAPPQSGRTTAQTVHAVMTHPNTLRSVFVLSELLEKPMSMRPDPLDRF
ncbi:MAG: hypothetical protein ACP5VQ_10105 [Phycisphaerae bacterium]